jgi:hypothetical protein
MRLRELVLAVAANKPNGAERQRCYRQANSDQWGGAWQRPGATESRFGKINAEQDQHCRTCGQHYKSKHDTPHGR